MPLRVAGQVDNRQGVSRSQHLEYPGRHAPVDADREAGTDSEAVADEVQRPVAVDGPVVTRVNRGHGLHAARFDLALGPGRRESPEVLVRERGEHGEREHPRGHHEFSAPGQHDAARRGSSQLGLDVGIRSGRSFAFGTEHRHGGVRTGRSKAHAQSERARRNQTDSSPQQDPACG